jgi:hypothetical protein
MMRVLLAMAVALTLSGCVQYDYAYHYDTYHGATGSYGAPYVPDLQILGLTLTPTAPPTAPPSYYFTGPHEAGYRGPYIAGPFYVPAAAPAPPAH